jgi:ankyrin repeat protein
MIEHKIDINSLNSETGTSALMLAAALGYLNICNILIDAGADINACDHAGNTPLHLAAQGYGEKAPVVKELLARGANPNVTNEDGFTPAMIAKQTGKDECFKILDLQTDEKKESPVNQETEEEEEQNDQNIFSLT